MKITYDPTKNAKNIDDRGLSFERAADFDFSSAKFWQDERKPYAEARYVAIGCLDDRTARTALCRGCRRYSRN